ncbi:MAG: hypothetical protein AAFQ41_04030 [Cyanobacteria bacterium J06623_7]
MIADAAVIEGGESESSPLNFVVNLSDAFEEIVEINDTSKPQISISDAESKPTIIMSYFVYASVTAMNMASTWH